MGRTPTHLAAQSAGEQEAQGLISTWLDFGRHSPFPLLLSPERIVIVLFCVCVCVHVCVCVSACHRDGRYAYMRLLVAF